LHKIILWRDSDYYFIIQLSLIKGKIKYLRIQRKHDKYENTNWKDMETKSFRPELIKIRVIYIQCFYNLFSKFKVQVVRLVVFLSFLLFGLIIVIWKISPCLLQSKGPKLCRLFCSSIYAQNISPLFTEKSLLLRLLPSI